MTSFKDVPDLLKASEVNAKNILPGTIEESRLPDFLRKPPTNEIVQSNVRVFGKPLIPVSADLVSRSVYPVKG